MSAVPRIRAVKPTGPTALEVTWADGHKDRVELSGWITTGGTALTPLRDPAKFKTAAVANFGAAVEWSANEDLAIDAVHLSRIAAEQRELQPSELMEWQSAYNLTNDEAAEVVGVSRSTWAVYKKKPKAVPATVVMSIRASLRDPILIHAHYRPTRGKAGRPRKTSGLSG